METYFHDNSEELLPKYKCPYCSYSTIFRTNLEAHKRRHTGERPFKCHICPKLFTTKGNLQVHIRVHTGERPFVCVQCKRSFAAQGSLKKHVCYPKKN